jgi:TolA-binding protein
VSYNDCTCSILTTVVILIVAGVVAAIALKNRSDGHRAQTAATQTAPAQQTAVAPPATSSVSVTAQPVLEEKTAATTTTPEAAEPVPNESPASATQSTPSAPAPAGPVQSAAASYGEGMRLLASGDVNAARKQFAALAESNPQDGRAHFRLGEIALLNHNFPHAADQFRSALVNAGSLDPRERALTELGLAIATEDRQTANGIAREIHRVRPNDPDLRRIREAFGMSPRPGEAEQPRPRRRLFRP